MEWIMTGIDLKQKQLELELKEGTMLASVMREGAVNARFVQNVISNHIIQIFKLEN